jgi:hypothetical protein
MQKLKDNKIFVFLRMIWNKLIDIKIIWDYSGASDAKWSKKNWVKVEGLFKTEMSNFIDKNNPDKDMILENDLFAHQCVFISEDLMPTKRDIYILKRR